MNRSSKSHEWVRDLAGESLPLLAFIAILGGAMGEAYAAGAGNANTVLISGSSTYDPSWAAQAAILGFTVEVANDASWNAKSTADFKTYKAIVIPDNRCSGPSAAAVNSRTTWSPAVLGNILIVGGDPDYHAGATSGAVSLIKNGIWFAANDPGKTGLYVAVGCSTASLPILDRFGTFAAYNSSVNAVHIVAVHPALEGLTDAMLSNWGTSTHLGFTGFPADFVVLAIQLNNGGAGRIDFADGTYGVPFLLAKGSGVQPVGLNITKSAAASVNVGSNLTYTITYGNSGGTGATSVVITDPVPAGTTFVSATGGGTLSGSNVVWNIGALAQKVTGQTVSFTVRANVAGTITNTAYSIKASGIEATVGSDVATTAIQVEIPPELVVTPGARDFLEDGAAVIVDPTLILTGPEGPDFTGAHVAITSGFHSSEDHLAFTAQGGVTGSYSAATGILALSGSAPVATYQAALRSVTYQDIQTADPTAGTRTITFSLPAGSMPGYPSLALSGSRAVNVIACGANCSACSSATVCTDCDSTYSLSGGVCLHTTSLVLSSSASPSTFGQAVQFTAAIGPSSAAGSVQFRIDGSAFGSPVTVSDGAAASAVISSLSATTHVITATFTGAGDFLASTGTFSQVVVKATPIVTVSTSVSPSMLGANVTFVATLSPTDPTGTVQFKDGGASLGGALAVYLGAITRSTSTLTLGTHVITAVYSGDANYNPVTGTLEGNQVVQQVLGGACPSSDVCASGLCGSNSAKCIPAGGNGCASDGDCSADRYCKGSPTYQCTPRLPNGTAIPIDGLHDGMCPVQTLAPTCAAGVCDARDNRCGWPNDSDQACAPGSTSPVCRSTVCDYDSRCGFTNSYGPCNPLDPSVCRSLVCDPDRKCGYPDGHPCTAGTASSCRSGTCGTGSHVCIPAGGCGTDADCSNGYCDSVSRTCHAKLPNGAPIPLDHDAGACSDPGIASVVCSSSHCDVLDNRCGYSNGHSCTSGTAANCRSGACSASGACVPTVGGCARDSDCADGYCDTTSSTCHATLPNGTPIPADHNSGACSAGVAAIVCTSDVCDLADNRCGYAAHHDCVLASDCRTGATCSSVSHVCVPSTRGCASDSDCGSDSFCETAVLTCHLKLANGTPIPQDHGSGACTSGPTGTGAQVCTSGVCSASDNLCGVPNGESCLGNAVCRSQQCSMSSGKCIPADGCYVDTDCDTATHFCHLEIHTCVLKLTNNSPVPDYRNQGRCSAEIGIALCESGVCDADNRCGYLNGDGPCTPTTPEVCRSTACSMQSSKCVPAVNGCTLDSECQGDAYCEAGSFTCHARLANGTPVPADRNAGVCSDAVALVVCGSGACSPADNACGRLNGEGCSIDTVCRSEECSTDTGKCIPANGCYADKDCSTDTHFCNTLEHLCQLKLANGSPIPSFENEGRCSAEAGIVTCQTGVCASDNRCGYPNGEGACTLDAAGVCRSGACGSISGACVPADKGCTLDSECDANSYCDFASFTCRGRLGNGSAIPQDHNQGGCTEGVAVVVCATGACSAIDNACGAQNGEACGSNPVCRSQQCSDVSGLCIPATGCFVNADCATQTHFCNTEVHLCRAKLANGSPLPGFLNQGRCSAEAGLVTCQTGVCAGDNRCGYPNGEGACTQDAAGGCRSGACGSISNTCVPADKGCTLDSECDANSYCDFASFTCKVKLDNGTVIPLDHDNGICGETVAVVVCATGACSAIDNACGAQNGEACGSNGVCRSQQCSDASGLCIPATGCFVNADCTTQTHFCNTEVHLCRVKLSNGSPLPGFLNQGRCSAEAGLVTCQSGVCDSDNRCGYRDGEGACTQDAAGGCRSGTCGSISNTCVPADKGCTLDSECDANSYCDFALFTCKDKLDNGSAIPPDHHNGNCDPTVAVVVCATGVCSAIDNACGAQNGEACGSNTVCRSQQCSDVSGLCIPATGCFLNADCATQTHFCNTDVGLCQLKIANGAPIPPYLNEGLCSAEAGTVACASGVCDKDNRCGFLDGDGPCAQFGSQVCRSLTCSSQSLTCVPAEGGCTLDAECKEDSFCDSVTLTCQIKLDNGAPIPTDRNKGVCSDPVALAVCATGACSRLDNACGYQNGEDCASHEVCRSQECSADTGKCIPAQGCFADADCDTATHFCHTEIHLCQLKVINGSPVPDYENQGRCSPAVGLAICQSGVCNSDNRCGYPNGIGPCDPQAAVVCRSGACGKESAKCVPADGGCVADLDCLDSQYCDFVPMNCLARLDNGLALPTDHDAGLCSAAVGLAVCASGVCSADNLCGYPNGEGPCSPDAAQVCRTLACSSASAVCVPEGGSGCTIDADCTAGQFCDGLSMLCQGKLVNGSALPADRGPCAGAVALAVCSSGICDSSTNLCGISDGKGPCTEDSQCVSGRCDPTFHECARCTGDQCGYAEVSGGGFGCAAATPGRGCGEGLVLFLLSVLAMGLLGRSGRGHGRADKASN